MISIFEVKTLLPQGKVKADTLMAHTPRDVSACTA